MILGGVLLLAGGTLLVFLGASAPSAVPGALAALDVVIGFGLFIAGVACLGAALPSRKGRW